MPPYSYRQIIVLVILMHLIVLLLIATAVLLRYVAFGEEHSETMVTDQQLWRRHSIFCKYHTISAQLDTPSQTFINSPPIFDVYAFTLAEYSDLIKTVVMRNFTLHSLSSIKPNKFKYHNYHFLNGTRIEATVCFTYNENSSETNLYMYLLKSEKVFNHVKRHLSKGSCKGFTRDVCDVKIIALNKTNSCDNETVNINTTDHYIFVYYYSTKSLKRREAILNLSYVIQRTQYDITKFGRIESQKTIVDNIRSSIILLDFPWLSDKPFGELYNIELTFSSVPNNDVYLIVFGGTGFLLVLLCFLICDLYIYFRRRFSYEQLIAE